MLYNELHVGKKLNTIFYVVVLLKCLIRMEKGMESSENIVNNEKTKDDVQYTFNDLFDVEEIQTIQDQVAKSLHVGSLIVEPDGTPITKPSNFCSFCYGVVRKSEVGCANCKKSDEYLGRPNTDGPIIANCLSANLLDAGCSIIVNGKHIASWLLGQVRNADVPADFKRNEEYAKMLGVDTEHYNREFQKIPAMTSEEFEEKANLIFIIVSQMAKLAAHNLNLEAEIERRNVLEQKLELEHTRLSYTATHDMLTNVYNRTYFEEITAKLTNENVYPVSVVVGDVNNLKVTNDVFGHKHGDILLASICDKMRVAAEEDYIICRCGGDEFYVIMPGHGYSEAKEFCEKVKQLCAIDTSNVITPSISFGYDTKTNEKKSLASAIRTADALMYKNKQSDKLASNVLIDIQRILYSKKYLSEEVIEKTLVLANAFGIYLKFDDELLKDINLLTELQDLGMIIVPDRIFFKDDPLTKEEFDFIKTHTLISNRLAKLYDNTYSVSKAVLHCHENFDGTGYPTKLEGLAIPYLSRVMHVINGYVAMISKRPYGIEKTHEDALVDIKEKSGTQYDPEIAASFIEFMKDYEF